MVIIAVYCLLNIYYGKLNTEDYGKYPFSIKRERELVFWGHRDTWDSELGNAKTIWEYKLKGSL